MRTLDWLKLFTKDILVTIANIVTSVMLMSPVHFVPPEHGLEHKSHAAPNFLIDTKGAAPQNAASTIQWLL